MTLSEKVAMHKWTKELKNELRQLGKKMISKGTSKVQTEEWMNELKNSLELGHVMHEEYENAVSHVKAARESITKLLDCMGESPAEEIKQSLQLLLDDLDMVYHICVIRKDDMDFASTMTCLRKMTAEYNGGNTIMLRSELENIKAVLDDVSGWNSPDFLALGYFLLHNNESVLGEMENEQRNEYVISCLNEHFWESFLQEAERCNVKSEVISLVRRTIIG